MNILKRIGLRIAIKRMNRQLRRDKELREQVKYYLPDIRYTLRGKIVLWEKREQPLTDECAAAIFASLRLQKLL